MFAKKGNDTKLNQSVYSPFLQKRQANELSNHQHRFFTPNLNLIDDENSTAKPDFRQMTVTRMQQSRTLRQQPPVSKQVYEPQTYQKQLLAEEELSERSNKQLFFTPYNQPDLFYRPKTLSKSEDIISKFKQDQKQKAIFQIGSHLEKVAAQNSFIFTHDLARQNERNYHNEYNQFEIEHLNYQLGSSFPFPSSIQQEILTQPEVQIGLLIDNLVYFAVGKKLILWNAGKIDIGISSKHQSSMLQQIGQFEFADSIQSVCYIELHNEDFKPYLCVVLSTEVQLMAFKPYEPQELVKLNQQIMLARFKYDLTKVVKSEFAPVPLGINEVVNNFVYFKKTGKIFFCSHNQDFADSCVKELCFYQDNFIIRKIKENIFGTNELKRVKFVKHAKSLSQLVVQQITPSFFNFFNQRKKYDDLKIDEQRNILYALSFTVNSNQSKGEASIEVYDLGIHGHNFDKLLTITQHEILERSRDITGQSYNHLKEILKVKSICPIYYMESLKLNLLIVTEGGYRIFVKIGESNVKSIPSISAVEEMQSQFDFLNVFRPGFNFEVSSIQKTPFAEEVLQRTLTKVEPMAYQIDSFKHLPSKRGWQGVVNKVEYSNDHSCLVFSDTNRTADAINLCFVGKNESLFSNFREKYNTENLEDVLEMQESLELSQIPLASHDEQIVKIMWPNQYEKLSSSMTINLQRMLGYNKALMLSQGWGLTNRNQYLHVSQLEKQVYETNSVIQVVTNKRILSVIKLRPIDHLVCILKSMASASAEFYSLDIFDQFANKFSVEEVLSMLVQVLAEFKHGTYLYSQLVERSLIEFRQFQMQENAYRGVNFQSRGSKQVHQFKFRQDLQGSQCELAKVENFKMNQLAQQLLLIIGDSVLKIQEPKLKENLNGYMPNLQVLLESSLEVLPLRLQAIVKYSQRILRPIWDMKLVYRPKKSSYDNLLSNVDSFKPALEKLQNLYQLLEKLHSQLMTRFSHEDLEILMRRKQSYNSSLVLFQLISFCNQLDSQSKDKLESLEQETLNNLILFVRRCIDVIEFLKIISFDGNQKIFAQMLSSISKEDAASKKSGLGILKELAKTSFKELVFQGSSDGEAFENQKSELVKRLFKASVHQSNSLITSDPSHTNVNIGQEIKKKTSMIQKLCPTLFSAESFQNIISSNLLAQALREKDQQRQINLVTEGVEQLKQRLDTINFSDIVPILLQLRFNQTIVDMCLRKVRYLQLLEEEESTFINSKEVAINECYEIIIDLFEALDQSISEQKFEMQTGVRRSKDQIKPNKTSGFYVTMFNCFHFDNKGVSVSEKVNLRKEILKLVMENEDTNLEKLLFIYLVNQENESSTMLQNELPQLSMQGFEEVVNELIFNSAQIKKVTLDLLVKLMLQNNKMKPALCQSVLRLCEDQNLQIIKFKSSEANKTKEAFQYYLDCSEKINYCQLALDCLRTDFDIEELGKTREQLQSNLEHYQHQVRVINALNERIEFLQRVKQMQRNQSEKAGIESMLEVAQQSLKTLHITKVEKSQLIKSFISELKLHEVMFETLADHLDQVTSPEGMNQPCFQTNLQNIHSQFLDVFVSMYSELALYDPQNEFQALILLQKHVDNYDVLLKAVKYVWRDKVLAIEEIQEDDKRQDKLTDFMANLLENKVLIYDSEIFGFIGHLYTCVLTGIGMQCLSGSTVNSVFKSYLEQCENSTSLQLALCAAMVSLNLWIDAKIDNLDVASNRTYKLNPSGFKLTAVQNSHQLHQKEILENKREISDQLAYIHEVYDRKKLYFKKKFTQIIDAYLEMLDEQINQRKGFVQKVSQKSHTNDRNANEMK